MAEITSLYHIKVFDVRPSTQEVGFIRLFRYRIPKPVRCFKGFVNIQWGSSTHTIQRYKYLLVQSFNITTCEGVNESYLNDFRALLPRKS